MPALRKPHRIGVVLPVVTIEGFDAAYRAEAALLLWMACLEACGRHPGLAVYEAAATPLVPLDGHLAPLHAQPGASPRDAFHAAARRDELIWLELGLPRGAVRLCARRRDDQVQTFDGRGDVLGEQLDHAIAGWLAARQLAPLPRRIDPITAEELIAVVRVIGAPLVEQAGDSPRSTSVRAVVGRLPATLRVPALRVLELAFGVELGDAILAADPDHPQARFARFLAGARAGRPDFALLRRVIAAAPGWARPYNELVPGATGELAPTALETVAGAGIAALCRPADLEVLRTAAGRLRDDGRCDAALRLMARALELHDHDPAAHAALLAIHRSGDRVGSWLAQAERSLVRHGCPLDPQLPTDPGQVEVELGVADALLRAGRYDEAIALCARHRDPRAAAWRDDLAVRARSYAREAHFRGDPARVVEGFARAAPEDGLELAMWLEALLATGREDAVAPTWGELGLGRGLATPGSRLAAARCLLAVGAWRRGLEELWRVELGAPDRDELAAIARCGRMLAAMPLDVAEAALAERVAAGAHSLARRMARDIADFVPGAAGSSIVTRALGKLAGREVDPASFDGFVDVPARAQLDALFRALAAGDRARSRRGRAAGRREPRGGVADAADPLAQADRLVERWLEVVHVAARDDDPTAIARAAAYVAAQALARYLAATTTRPSVIAGGLRTVAAEALALVRRHRDALADREIRALLGAIDPLLRRVDRWVGTGWLGAVERACGIDERAGGDVAGFARDHATVAARMLGPEETAVLASSLARLHRERPARWQSPAAAQAAKLALHTGRAGLDEWADATAAQLAARALEPDDALDALHLACFLAEGLTAGPAIHAARVLLDVGRAPAALAVLAAAMPGARPAQRAQIRDALVGRLAAALELPPTAERALAALVALGDGERARAERLARWALVLAPDEPAAHRALGVALARQGKRIEAIAHLTRAGVPSPRAVVEDLQPERTVVEATHGPVFDRLEIGDFAGAAACAEDPSWRVRRVALVATRHRSRAEDAVGVPAAALATAARVIAATAGVTDRDAASCRALALSIRDRAVLARDPAPRLGERIAREALDGDAPAPPSFEDRVVFEGGKVARISDLVALLRDLAALPPRDALAQFDLDDASYLELARSWAEAIDDDPTLRDALEAGLARR